MAADKTSVVSAEKTSVVSRATTCVAAAEKTSDLSMKSTTPWGAPSAPPQGVVDEIEMSGVFSAAATDVLALDATDVFSADTTDVLSAAKAADGGSCPAITWTTGFPRTTGTFSKHGFGSDLDPQGSKWSFEGIPRQGIARRSVWGGWRGHRRPQMYENRGTRAGRAGFFGLFPKWSEMVPPGHVKLFPSPVLLVDDT